MSKSPDPAAQLLAANRAQTVGPSLITGAPEPLVAAYPDKNSSGVSKAILSTPPPPNPQGGTPSPTPANAWELVSRTK